MKFILSTGELSSKKSYLDLIEHSMEFAKGQYEKNSPRFKKQEAVKKYFLTLRLFYFAISVFKQYLHDKYIETVLY